MTVLHDNSRGELKGLEAGVAQEDPGFFRTFHAAASRMRGEGLPPRPNGPIVVGVDGSPAALDAVRWAAVRAQATGADLRLVHAFGWPTAPDLFGLGAVAVMPAGMDEHDSVVESAADLAAAVAPASATSHVSLHGSGAEALVAEAAGATLLVLGRGHTDTMHAVVLRSTLIAVTEQVDVPVVIVPHAERADDPHRRRSRVVVAIGGGGGWVRALRQAFALASDGDGSVHAVRAGRESEAAAAWVQAARDAYPGVQMMTSVSSRSGLLPALLQASRGAATTVINREVLRLPALVRGRAGRRWLAQVDGPVVFPAR